MTYNSLHVMSRLIDSKHLAKPAQVGVDLTLKKIQRVLGEVDGCCPYMDADSVIHNIAYKNVNADDKGYFHLEPNMVYIITFDQGLDTLQPNEYANLTVRSSLNRIGIRIMGSVFDPGYHISEEQGLCTTLFMWNIPIMIHEHARVCQFQIHECEPVPEAMLYTGRWQGTNNVLEL